MNRFRQKMVSPEAGVGFFCRFQENQGTKADETFYLFRILLQGKMFDFPFKKPIINLTESMSKISCL